MEVLYLYLDKAERLILVAISFICRVIHEAVHNVINDVINWGI